MMKVLLFLSALAACAVCVMSQTSTYDEDQLEIYARLTKQFITEMEKKLSDLQIKINQYIASPGAVSVLLSATYQDMVDYMLELKGEVVASTLSLQSMPSYAHVATTPEVLQSSTDPLYSNVMYSNNFELDASTYSVTVPVEGIYFIDTKLQTADSRGVFSFTFKYGDTDHSEYVDWEITPFLDMVHLTAGSVVSFDPLDDEPVSDIETGPASQFSIRYLGQAILSNASSSYVEPAQADGPLPVFPPLVGL